MDLLNFHNMKLTTPISEELIRSLHVGDLVEISGVLFTGRDAVHKFLHDGGSLPVDMRGGLLYHCGPVMVKDGAGWKCVAAGPTTSAREEPYQAEVIQKLGLRGVIGKGGMGEKTLAGCKEFGAVYLHAVGGAAQVLAECVKRIRSVHMLEEFGSPEAVWEMEVESFPCVVTMDSHGGSLHKDVYQRSKEALQKYL